MRSYQHVTPPLRIFSGENSLASLERELQRLGIERAVLFCGATLGQPGSPVDLIRSALGNRLAAVFTGVKAHSPVPAVEVATQALREVDADGAIAVGGGSAIVTARGASILLAEGREPADLSTRQDANGKMTSPRLEAPKIPQIIIPTTPTTAIVKAGTALLDPATKMRMAMFDPKTRAQSVFIHPALVGSAPEELIISASLNTLAMSIEGLMSRNGDPIADGQLIHALRLAFQRLGNRTELSDPAARADLVVAAMLCGQGTDHSGAGVTTVLGHAVGGHFGVENGVANAIMLPHALRFNAAHAEAGLAKIGAALGLPADDPAALLEAVIDALARLTTGLGVPSRLRDVGVAQEDFAKIAEHAMKDWFLRGNPRPVNNAAQLQQLLVGAW